WGSRPCRCGGGALRVPRRTTPPGSAGPTPTRGTTGSRWAFRGASRGVRPLPRRGSTSPGRSPPEGLGDPLQPGHARRLDQHDVALSDVLAEVGQGVVDVLVMGR